MDASLRGMDEQRMMTAPAFLKIMAHWHPQLDSLDDCLPAPRAREEQPFRERLWSVRNLISTLDEAVGAAPEQLIQTVLNVLHFEILHPTLRLSERQINTVMATLAELDHEATRFTPDAAQFSRRALLVVDILLLA
jgi:hypothetical protein